MIKKLLFRKFSTSKDYDKSDQENAIHNKAWTALNCREVESALNEYIASEKIRDIKKCAEVVESIFSGNGYKIQDKNEGSQRVEFKCVNRVILGACISVDNWDVSGNVHVGPMVSLYHITQGDKISRLMFPDGVLIIDLKEGKPKSISRMLSSVVNNKLVCPVLCVFIALILAILGVQKEIIFSLVTIVWGFFAIFQKTSKTDKLIYALLTTAITFIVLYFVGA